MSKISLFLFLFVVYLIFLGIAGVIWKQMVPYDFSPYLDTEMTAIMLAALLAGINTAALSL